MKTILANNIHGSQQELFVARYGYFSGWMFLYDESTQQACSIFKIIKDRPHGLKVFRDTMTAVASEHVKAMKAVRVALHNPRLEYLPEYPFTALHYDHAETLPW